MCLNPIFPQGPSKIADSRLALPRHIIPPSSLDDKFIVILSPEMTKEEVHSYLNFVYYGNTNKHGCYNCLTFMDVLDECFQFLKRAKYPIIFSL